MSNIYDIHIADLICPRCCYPVGNAKHYRNEETDRVECQYDDERVAGETDRRFAPRTNAALTALNTYVTETYHKISVSQHAQLMRRVDGVVETALTEGPRQAGCRPGAWGGDGCLAHEGHEIGPDGKCIEGRASHQVSTEPGK